MDELNPKKPIEGVLLYIRADERIEMIASEQHDVQINFREHKNEVAEKFRDQNGRIEYLIGRMDNQVSKTGKENTEAIAVLTTRVTIVEKTEADMMTKLFDKDTGFVPRIEAFVTNINRLTIAFVITGCAGGIVLWAFKTFR